jgi:transcriptional regulator with XRE-family HTH domain
MTGATPRLQEPGQQLRRARERLRLRFRDVKEASQRIATQSGIPDFFIGLSRLSDIENKGTVPSVYRLYSLCAIYGLDFSTILAWYGVELKNLASDSATLALDQTHPVGFEVPDRTPVPWPVEVDPGFDLKKTFYLSRHVTRWGKLPLALLNSLDLQHQRYAFIGINDWSMYPIIPPGSFVQIDEGKRRISKEGWVLEYERPIYFLEYRTGYRCGWCTERDGVLIVQPFSTSHASPDVLRFPADVEVIGQIVGVAMRLDLAKRHRTHF